MRTKYRCEVGDSHVTLPQLIHSYSDINLEAVIALEVDNEECFMLFVTVPRFNELISKLCLYHQCCTWMERI